MKSKQFCSVCKDWLEMEVVPTGDGDDDDGVIWFRCPQCQGFLPKLSGGDLQPEVEGEPDAAQEESAGDTGATADTGADGDMPWDSPSEMMAAQETDAEIPAGEAAPGPGSTPEVPDFPAFEAPADNAPEGESPAPDTVASGAAEAAEKKADEPPPEPIHEYAAMLAAADVSTSTPYRPWATYEVGQCLHHLAWDDCGIVVEKEELPGGRKVIKCYFEEAGVVRLIEQAPR